MTEYRTEQLVAIAPHMFRYEGWNDYSKSLISTFDVGDGWYLLLKDLIESLAKIDFNKEIQVFQIKEKFGGLRFYVEGLTDPLYDVVCEMIRIAEERSYNTCEECGKEGKMRKDGWLRVLCDGCDEERKKNV